MEYTAPKSICNLCKSEFTTKGIGRHISSCLKRQSPKTKNTLTKKYCYLSVRDIDNSDYFIFLLISQDSTLDDFDTFLRKIWLECCGHMSSFSYKKWGEEISMSTKIQNVCNAGSTLIYLYDFGSTTELQVKLYGQFSGFFPKLEDIILLSRNSEPIIPCDECGKFQAVHICTECQWDNNGWLCEKCAKTHECGDDMFLPVVNSPRAGVCAYYGEEEKERPIPKSLQDTINDKKDKIKILKLK